MALPAPVLINAFSQMTADWAAVLFPFVPDLARSRLASPSSL
jgi:hypothetical protein